VVFPNDALEMIAALLGGASRDVLIPYILSASAITLSVLQRREGFVVAPHRLPMLAVLHFRPGISQAELARHLGVRRATIGPKVADCMGEGLVERQRSASDTRRFALKLSAAGSKIVSEAVRLSPQWEREVAGVLTLAERRTLRQLLIKVLTRNGA